MTTATATRSTAPTWGGTFSFKGLLSAVAVVGEIASLIPGPIGAAAAGVSAVAYAVQGNTAKALEMGVTAAAALVGAGPVVRVAARAASTAIKAGQTVARAAPRIARTAGQRVAALTRSTPAPTTKIYSSRVLQRMANEPGPYHNFPGSFDATIFATGSRTVVPNKFTLRRPNLQSSSIQYRLQGTINGRQGTYEIFTRPSTSGRSELIMHRFFRPN